MVQFFHVFALFERAVFLLRFHPVIIQPQNTSKERFHLLLVLPIQRWTNINIRIVGLGSSMFLILVIFENFELPFVHQQKRVNNSTTIRVHGGFTKMAYHYSHAV